MACAIDRVESQINYPFERLPIGVFLGKIYSGGDCREVTYSGGDRRIWIAATNRIAKLIYRYENSKRPALIFIMHDYDPPTARYWNTVLSLGSKHITTCLKSWKIIADLKPLNLILGPNVVIRSDSFRLIEAAHSNLNPISEIFFVHRNGAATVWSKATFSEL